MNLDERLQLQKLIGENNVSDQTDLIRSLKHSVLLRNDVNQLIELKAEYLYDMNGLKMASIMDCTFLYTYYTDIYNKIIKDELDVQILYKFLDALKEIEDGKLDQHEASYKVGTLLKKIYVDSALKKAEKLDKERADETVVLNNGQKISWRQFKKKSV